LSGVHRKERGGEPFPRAVVNFRRHMLNEPEVIDLPWQGKLALIEEILRAAANGNREYIAASPYVVSVRWGRPAGFRPTIPRRIRDEVRAIGRCEACRHDEPPFEIDHVIPYSRGGSHERSNLQLLCRPCNRDKYNRTMEEWLA
jgi:hypothetical protein